MELSLKISKLQNRKESRNIAEVRFKDSSQIRVMETKTYFKTTAFKIKGDL